MIMRGLVFSLFCMTSVLAEEVKVGQLLVLTSPLEGSRSKWIIPADWEPIVLKTQTQLATIPSQIGTFEFIFIEVGEEIKHSRVSVKVTGSIELVRLSVPKDALSPVAAKDEDSPVVIFYSAPFDCPPCDKWKREEYPELSRTGWLYAEEKTGTGITSFPSFEIRVGDKKAFYAQYLTAKQIKYIVEELQ